MTKHNRKKHVTNCFLTWRLRGFGNGLFNYIRQQHSINFDQKNYTQRYIKQLNEKRFGFFLNHSRNFAPKELLSKYSLKNLIS